MSFAAARRDAREVDCLLARVLIDRQIRRRVDRRRIVDVIIQPAKDILAVVGWVGLALPDDDGIPVGIGGDRRLSLTIAGLGRWLELGRPDQRPPELTRWARIVAGRGRCPTDAKALPCHDEIAFAVDRYGGALLEVTLRRAEYDHTGQRVPAGVEPLGLDTWTGTLLRELPGDDELTSRLHGDRRVGRAARPC